MDIPILSVVLPCYNESKGLENILKRFQEVGAGVNFELILVDNGSTDNSPEVLASLLPRYPFARSVRVEKNVGYGIKRLLFNAAQPALSLGIATWVFETIGGAPLDQSTHITQTILPLTALTAVYFGLNSGLLAVAIALETNTDIPAVWKRLWPLSVNYIAAASAAFCFVIVMRQGGGGLRLWLRPESKDCGSQQVERPDWRRSRWDNRSKGRHSRGGRRRGEPGGPGCGPESGVVHNFDGRRRKA